MLKGNTFMDDEMDLGDVEDDYEIPEGPVSVRERLMQFAKRNMDLRGGLAVIKKRTKKKKRKTKRYPPGYFDVDDVGPWITPQYEYRAYPNRPPRMTQKELAKLDYLAGNRQVYPAAARKAVRARVKRNRMFQSGSPMLRLFNDQIAQETYEEAKKLLAFNAANKTDRYRNVGEGPPPVFGETPYLQYDTGEGYEHFPENPSAAFRNNFPNVPGRQKVGKDTHTFLRTGFGRGAWYRNQDPALGPASRQAELTFVKDSLRRVQPREVNLITRQLGEENRTARPLPEQSALPGPSRRITPAQMAIEEEEYDRAVRASKGKKPIYTSPYQLQKQTERTREQTGAVGIEASNNLTMAIARNTAGLAQQQRAEEQEDVYHSLPSSRRSSGAYSLSALESEIPQRLGRRESDEEVFYDVSPPRARPSPLQQLTPAQRKARARRVKLSKQQRQLKALGLPPGSTFPTNQSPGQGRSIQEEAELDEDDEDYFST